MFYVISYDDGEMKNGEFENYSEALSFAEKHNTTCNFTIEEYDSEKDYPDNFISKGWKTMIKRPDLKDLKVGDTVYVLKNVNPTFACFRYRFISEETIVRITPKRTKFITNKGEYTNRNPFVIPDERLKAEHNVAKAYLFVKDFCYRFSKEDLINYSDDEISQLAELTEQVKNIIDKHNRKEQKNE